MADEHALETVIAEHGRAKMPRKMTDLDRLHTETDAAKLLLQAFADILADDDEVADTAIEGETNLKEAMNGALKRIGEIDALRDAIKSRMTTLEVRDKRLERQEDLLRTALLTAMEVADWVKYEGAEATVSRRVSPAKVEIIREADIPARFWKQPDPVIDKKAVGTALKAHEDVPGAMLSNGGQTISIRWR